MKVRAVLLEFGQSLGKICSPNRRGKRDLEIKQLRDEEEPHLFATLAAKRSPSVSRFH